MQRAICPLPQQLQSISAMYRSAQTVPSSVSNSLMASMTFALSAAKCCLKFSSLSPPEVSSLCRDSCWSVSSLLPRDLQNRTEQTSKDMIVETQHSFSWTLCNLEGSDTRRGAFTTKTTSSLQQKIHINRAHETETPGDDGSYRICNLAVKLYFTNLCFPDKGNTN